MARKVQVTAIRNRTDGKLECGHRLTLYKGNWIDPHPDREEVLCLVCPDDEPEPAAVECDWIDGGWHDPARRTPGWRHCPRCGVKLEA